MGKLMRALLLGTIILAFMASSVFSDEAASATKRVVVVVLPNIGIGAGDPAPLVGIQTGKFKVTVPFTIDANTQYVAIQIVATHLYKADDPASEVPPIALEQGEKVYVKPLNGNESTTTGADNKLEWEAAASIDGFEGFQTVTGIFESSQAGRFSMPVDVQVTWNQVDPEKPVGEYSGFVKMLAAVVLITT